MTELPHSKQLEKSIINAIIFSEEFRNEHFNKLRKECFFTDIAQGIFIVIDNLLSEGLPISLPRIEIEISKSNDINIESEYLENYCQESDFVDSTLITELISFETKREYTTFVKNMQVNQLIIRLMLLIL